MIAGEVEVKGEEMCRRVGEICDFGPRRPGLPGFEKARDYLVGKIEDLGVEVWLEEIEIPMYYHNNPELKTISPEEADIACFPLYFAGSTPAGRLETELVYVGKGSALEMRSKDLRGKVALVSRGKRVFAKAFVSLESIFINSYGNAIKRGAVGVIAFFENTPENAYVYSVISRGVDMPTQTHPLPGLSIGKEDGFRLAELCKRGPVRVSMNLQGEVGTAKTYTIMALLPGRTEEIIIVDGHWCSTFTGAVDNAAGNAAFLEALEHFSRIPQEKREKTMLFHSASSHEYGLCNIAAYTFMERYPEYASRVVFAMGMDHVVSNAWEEVGGRIVDDPTRDNPRFISMSENFRLYPLVRKAYKKYGIRPLIRIPGTVLCETGVFQNMGIPTVRLVGTPLGYHTPWDTMDHFNEEQLVRFTKAHIELLEEIHKIPGQRLRAANLWRHPYLSPCGGLMPNPYEPGKGENLLRRLIDSKAGRIMKKRYSYIP
jgi:Peptidase family M28/PA domain